jgi:SAM-dependent methyltransferase
MEEAIYHKTAAYEESHWWFSGRRRIIETVLHSLSLPSNPKILEVGCGTGGNLSLLSHYGEVYGVEQDTFARNYALNRQIAPILPGSLPYDIPYQDNFFDLIVLLDVLEHVEEDGLSLVQLHKKLKPGGYLLITVPAFPALWSAHDEAHHHKRRYTLKTLGPIVREANYKIIFHSYMNTILFPIIAGLRVIKQSRGNDDLFMPPSILNYLLYKTFAIERHLLKLVSLPFGTSLLVLARRGLSAG